MNSNPLIKSRVGLLAQRSVTLSFLNSGATVCQVLSHTNALHSSSTHLQPVEALLQTGSVLRPWMSSLLQRGLM